MAGNPHLKGAGKPRCAKCKEFLSEGRCVFCPRDEAPASAAPQTAPGMEGAPQVSRPKLEPPPNLARLHARKAEMQRFAQQSGQSDAVATCTPPSVATPLPRTECPAEFELVNSAARPRSGHAGSTSPRASTQHGAPSPARASRDVDVFPPCSVLEATELDCNAARALEEVIRSMDPAWSRLNVEVKARRGARSYIINVHGQGEHHCINKGGAHGRSKVYFTVTPKGVAQKCPSGRESGDRCACYRSDRAPLPVRLRAALFPASTSSVCPETVQESVARSAGAAENPSPECAAPPASVADAEPEQAAPPGAKRKRTNGSAGPDVKLRKFAPPVLGANGRPLVLAHVKYSVDLAGLQQYAATEEAGRTKACHDIKELRAALTEREVIERFLQHVVPTANGDGLCTVSYTRSEVGQALLEAGLVQHSRLYPDTYWSCATQLGEKLRNIALGKFYVEMDDKDAFHKLLQARTVNSEAKEVIERIISDRKLKEELSLHYFDVVDRQKDVKTLLHRVSNGGSSREWQKESGISRADHLFVLDLQRFTSQVAEELAATGEGPAAISLIAERFPLKKRRVPKPEDPTKFKLIEVARDPARCWKSYLLQHDEARGLLAKMQTAARLRIPIGPPLHDCLFVSKELDEEAVAAAMTQAVAGAVDVQVLVRPKRIPRPIEDRNFHLNFDPARFREGDFVSNAYLTSQAEVDQSLGEYNSWLGRFFVAIIDEINPLIAQVFYSPGTDRVDNVVCRTPKDTRLIFLDMDIVTRVPVGRKGGQSCPLLEWYLRYNPRRHTKEHVNMWTSPEDIEAHPNDLNIFGGLDFDERFRDDPDKPLRAPFRDPLPTSGLLPRCAAGLKGAAQTSVLGADAEWRTLEGLPFIIWHVKYILCGGHEPAFGYTMQWFAYTFQERKKPGVMLQMLGEEGIGKSAIFGHNQTGPGIIKRIYGRYFQWTDDIDSLLGKFNGQSMDRLFCVMEEAGTYRKGHKDHNKMKSMITEGVMNVELKHINAVTKNDHRAFAMLTNNRDSLKITDGARRFLCLEGNGALSQKAVDEGTCSKDTRHEYMAKLDRTKNDEEVAYAFFKYCMLLDLSCFRVEEPPRTALFEEQRSHNECALKLFLRDVESGAYPLETRPGECAEFLQGEHTFTANELFKMLKRYMSETGAQSSIDSAMSLGHSLSKNYAHLAPKAEGRVAKYRLRVAV